MTRVFKWFRGLITINEGLAKGLIRLGFVIVFLIFIFFIWAEFGNFSLHDAINDSKFGQLGSILSGAVGTLWALAGVVLIYVTLQNQVKDSGENKSALKKQQEAFQAQIDVLHEQVEEFKLQRKELVTTRDVYVEQSNTQRLQRFENTFFQLTSLHHNIVSSFDLRQIRNAKNVIAVGRDCFKVLTNRLNSKINELTESNTGSILDCFLEIYNVEQADLSHYFRNLYHIYKFIDLAEVDKKKVYVGIIRAQLSAYELVLLFYNCLAENGVYKFKPLIEKYRVFKNLDIKLIRGGKETIKQYAPTAFGRKDFTFLDSYEDWT